MAYQKELVIGTFLYAASSKSYVVYHLIFTSKRVIAASASWEKNNILIDLFIMLQRAFFFTSVSTDTIQMELWRDIKQNAKGQFVSYSNSESERVLSLGIFSTMIHEILITPYSMLKCIEIAEGRLTDDYILKFGAGPLASTMFIVPSASLKELKELISKTPVSAKIKESGLF
ncbi:MAG: hypothetical protein KGH64_02485 [Candidatus Micrarchaeota archaeon]|nr:hypothetical protein [Candidatus Micrarchaeota archaeon]MDE1834182.1 hypothetical protein [Candidatus Micrarchaeota archaeon]MDE1859154.1 hypothetical protein [Candidatus Micrarchaeota archaeon]